MEPIISKLTYSQHQNLEFSEPNRTPGILAATEYLEKRVRLLRTTALVPAAILTFIAIAVAFVAWAINGGQG